MVADLDRPTFLSWGGVGGSTWTGPSCLMAGLEAAPIVFVDVALTARAEGGIRVWGAVRSWGVER